VEKVSAAANICGTMYVCWDVAVFVCGTMLRCRRMSPQLNGSTLKKWFVDVYIGGKQWGLGNPNVDGCKHMHRRRAFLYYYPSRNEP
jgi:hypothetical protein